MEKGPFGDVFGPSFFKKSHLSYEKGMKTHDFLKIKLLCEILQRNETFNRQMSPLSNQDIKM